MRANIIPVLFMTGCATAGSITGPIDYDRAPPADWPRLAEQRKAATAPELEKLCGRAHANGCAMANFARGTCTIYTSTDAPEVLAHERAHCAGYDHPGESTTRDAWQAFKEKTR